MKILVINGDCIQTNSSANLCHMAYIRGLLSAGHDVTLLSADGRDYKLDPSLVIPEGVEHYTYYGVSLYEKLSLKKQAAAAPAASAPAPAGEPSAPGLGRKVKDAVLSLYGVHGIYATFVRKARKFRSEREFDYVLSISTPVTSHLLTHKLLSSGNVKAKHWVQIWEDPWYADAYGFNRKEATRREEARLLSFAEKVCYVSPLTLKNQQRLFPEAAHKMFWQPLPFYYKSEPVDMAGFAENRYGYFGDYTPIARDLVPFYEAARETGIRVNICGNPSNLLPSTENITVHPRLPLDQLKPIEDWTNVLIFLCNRKGGQIPGKIYQYSATNKTVLFILDGTEEEREVLQGFFGKFNRYVFCRNTKEDIARAIRDIEAGNTGDVKNEPIGDFDPVITIENILKAGS